MVYLFILIFVLSNIYAAEKLNIKRKSVYLISVLPAVFCLILFPSIQNGVGSDYHSYIEIYNGSLDELYRFYLRGEYLFYYVFKFVIDYRIGGNSIFFLSTTFNVLFLFLFLLVMKKNKYNICILFFLFFIVTNNYHNQMNGIRQYMAVFLVPIMYCCLVEKKKIKFLIFVAIAGMLHKTALVTLILYPISLLLKLNKRAKLLIFSLIPFLFLISYNVVYFAIDNYIPMYKHYITSEYGEALTFSSMLSKLYYLPVFVLFWIYYLRDKSELQWGMDLAIVIWVCTYWLFVFYLQFGFAYRISAYFFIFYIFPCYYLLNFQLVRNNKVSYVLTILYLLAPYIVKVVYIPRGVFLYSSILF